MIVVLERQLFRKRQSKARRDKSLLGGIGFTVSLFVTELSFETETLLTDAKVGILLASALAGAIGFAVLRAVTRPARG